MIGFKSTISKEIVIYILFFYSVFLFFKRERLNLIMVKEKNKYFIIYLINFVDTIMVIRNSSIKEDFNFISY